MSIHGELVEDATAAIRRVHSDTTVSLEQTLESLEILEEELGELICAVGEDIRRREESEVSEL